jgi:hypothetical protein
MPSAVGVAVLRQSSCAAASLILVNVRQSRALTADVYLSHVRTVCCSVVHRVATVFCRGVQQQHSQRSSCVWVCLCVDECF